MACQMSKESRECPSRVGSRDLEEMRWVTVQLPGESRCKDPEVQSGVSFQEQEDPSWSRECERERAGGGSGK